MVSTTMKLICRLICESNFERCMCTARPCLRVDLPTRSWVARVGCALVWSPDPHSRKTNPPEAGVYTMVQLTQQFASGFLRCGALHMLSIHLLLLCQSGSEKVSFDFFANCSLQNLHHRLFQPWSLKSVAARYFTKMIYFRNMFLGKWLNSDEWIYLKWTCNMFLHSTSQKSSSSKWVTSLQSTVAGITTELFNLLGTGNVSLIAVVPLYMVLTALHVLSTRFPIPFHCAQG